MSSLFLSSSSSSSTFPALSGLLDRQSVRFKSGEIHHTWVIYDEHYQIAPPKQPKHEIQLQTWNIILEHLSSSYWFLAMNDLQQLLAIIPFPISYVWHVQSQVNLSILGYPSKDFDYHLRSVHYSYSESSYLYIHWYLYIH